MEAVSTRATPLQLSQPRRVLIADDESHILAALQMLLRGHGFSTETVTQPSRLLRALETEQFDAVIMDLNYVRGTVEGVEGLELVTKIRSMDSVLPILVMTAWSSVDLAVEAMRRGASDFVQKPWDNQDLLDKLRKHVCTAWEQRREQRLRDEELQEARAIQAGLLPKTLPEVPGFQIAAMTQPLRYVGGDFYSIARLGERQTSICIADVAGKGLPAALLMSSLQAALKPLNAQRLAPRELCQRLNRIMCDLTPVGKFISFFYGVIDSDTRRLCYCNAGHNPPLLMCADGNCSELSASGAVLGQFPNWAYEQSEIAISSGDHLLFFTDGLVEACNAAEDPFGEHNLIRIAREHLRASAEEMLQLLIAAAATHSGGQFQDDSTLIVLKADALMH